jgi:hypothetical protein
MVVTIPPGIKPALWRSTAWVVLPPGIKPAKADEQIDKVKRDAKRID